MVKFRLAYHISILFQVGCLLWSELVTRREEEDSQRGEKKTGEECRALTFLLSALLSAQKGIKSHLNSYENAFHRAV